MDVREWLYIARELDKNKSINKISKKLGRRFWSEGHRMLLEEVCIHACQIRSVRRFVE